MLQNFHQCSTFKMFNSGSRFQRMYSSEPSLGSRKDLAQGSQSEPFAEVHCDSSYVNCYLLHFVNGDIFWKATASSFIVSPQIKIFQQRCLCCKNKHANAAAVSLLQFNGGWSIVCKRIESCNMFESQGAFLCLELPWSVWVYATCKLIQMIPDNIMQDGLLLD